MIVSLKNNKQTVYTKNKIYIVKPKPNKILDKILKPN